MFTIQLQIPFDRLVKDGSTDPEVHNNNTTTFLQPALNTVNLGCLLTMLKNNSGFQYHELPALGKCHIHIQEQTFHDTLALLVHGNPHRSLRCKFIVDHAKNVTEEVSGNLQLTVESSCLTKFLYHVLKTATVTLHACILLSIFFKTKTNIISF